MIPVARRIVAVYAAAHVSASSGSRAGSCGAIGDGGDLRVGQHHVLPRPDRLEPRGLRRARTVLERIAGDADGPMLTPNRPSFDRLPATQAVAISMNVRSSRGTSGPIGA